LEGDHKGCPYLEGNHKGCPYGFYVIIFKEIKKKVGEHE
jgi:hypothetical protein